VVEKLVSKAKSGE